MLIDESNDEIIKSMEQLLNLRFNMKYMGLIDVNDEMIKSTEQLLNLRFNIKYMGLIDVILGINITKIF